jgi:hypothetical protein
MSIAMWGLVAGVLISVAIPLIWTSGGAGGALLVPLYALLLAPAGWLIGHFVEKLNSK